MPQPRAEDLVIGPTVAEREGKEIRLATIKNNASEETIKAVTDFYNTNFTEKHTVRGRMKRYGDAETAPVNIAVVADGGIVGLLESRLMAMEHERVRLLATLLIDPAYRELRLSRFLFDKFMRSVETKVNVVVRFRDSNRQNLECLYRRFGFSDPEDDGEYKHSKEKRWRMTLARTESAR
jgi:hypothetical protein